MSHLNDHLIIPAKRLRRDSTFVEKILWGHLRNGRLSGIQFRRQQPLERYIADFAALNEKVIVELDGGQHAVNHRRDISRDRWLYENGFKVLRFWNNEILDNPTSVLEKIQNYCLATRPSIPSRRGRGRIAIENPKTGTLNWDLFKRKG